MFRDLSESKENSCGITGLDAMKIAKILETSPNEIYIGDAETLKIEYANPKAVENLGYSLKELQQMTPLDFVPKFTTEEEFRKLVYPLEIGQKTQINLERIHCRCDGSHYPVEVNLQLIKEYDKTRFLAIVADISNRKNVEHRLKDKTKQLETVTNNIPCAIYQVNYCSDGEIKLEYVSDRVEDILEVSKEAIYADFNNFIKLVHEEDYNSLIENLRKGKTDLNPLFWEGRIITPSQRLVWVQARSQAEQKADGTVIRHGVFLDITAQKEAELALQETEEKFRQFAENIDDIFWMIDPNLQKLFYVSPAYEKIWGYSSHLVIENPINFLKPIHPDDRGKVEAAISGPILQKQDTEYRIIRPNGEIRWLRDRAFPIKNQKGEIYRVAGIAQDITKEKQAEAEILRNKELREVIFDEATDALYLIDPESLRVLDCNLRAVELAAASNKKALIDLKANSLHEKPFSEVKEIIEKQKTWSQELLLTDLKGEQFWGDVAWKQIEVGGQDIYLVRITDISDRKAFESELKTANECLELTNQKLSRATRLKDEFLANMSHELKTPLNAILGISEGLQESSFQAISETQKQAVKTINTSAKHLLALINDILDLSIIQAGKITLTFTQVNVKSFCESSLYLVRQQALVKNIQINLQFNTFYSRIQVDELRMRQILINLLSNAIKFTPKGGKVTLNVTEDEQREHIIFAVSDTGIGIPSDKIDQIFEPFIQLDGQFDRNYSGTGLGLSLVRRLTELHCGSIWVESQVGKGSTFYIQLPHTEVCVISDQHPSDFYSQQITNLSVSPLILLLDSESAILETHCSYLEASGYQTIGLSETDKLFPTLEEYSPQIIVIDLEDLGEIGRTIITQLREIPSLDDTPIMAMIATDTEEEILALGANACLVKPIRLRHLINLIQHWLGGEFPQ